MRREEQSARRKQRKGLPRRDIADCFSANRTVVAGIVTGQPGRKGSMAGSDETRLDWDHFFRETLIMAAF